jgi:crotonobetainyl-CoA:carnitine CoA-transferase CaiB-like acyl-CoA transferase
MAENTSAEWLGLLREADIPSMPMNSLADLIEDPHLADVGFFQTRQHPSEGAVRMMVVPGGLTAGGDWQISPAPHLGQHSTEVLREAGLGDDQIVRLIEAKIVRQAASAAKSSQ